MDPAASMELQLMSQKQPINDAIAVGNSEIQSFYCNTAVLVTGGSGFLGKQLIEKLFRSCKIRKMFLLMRPKKGKDVKQRLSEVLKDQVFEALLQNQPDITERIVIVEGDVSLPRLGISDQDWTTIAEEVTVIFHGAATTKFDEPLQSATRTNVRGTREMLYLARDCKLLRSFVHISTAYSHATVSKIGGSVLEQFYPVSIAPDFVIQLVETLDLQKLNKIANLLMEDWPNTYCFTKALAEDLVRTLGAGLPVCIVRPAIVCGAFLEPLPGWVDTGNLYGPSGLALGFMTGVIHVIKARSNVRMDLVPVDLVNNAVISAGWNTEKRWHNGEREINIYTVSSMRNFITFGRYINILHEANQTMASPKALWYFHVFLVTNDVSYALLSFLFHSLPTKIVDGVCMLRGKQPKLRPVYDKVQKLSSVLKYFMMKDWNFCDRNLKDLYDSMSVNDKIIFNFDVATNSNTEMVVAWNLGIRKYLLKDGLKGTEYGVKKQKVFKILSFVILFIYICSFFMMVQFLFVLLSSLIM